MKADEIKAAASKAISERGVFKGSHGFVGLLNADDFWAGQPYGTRLYYGNGGLQYLHRSVLKAAVEAIAENGAENDRLREQVRELAEALRNINHMGGDERGGYCICPLHDGSAQDRWHATVCADARAALAKLQQS